MPLGKAGTLLITTQIFSSEPSHVYLYHKHNSYLHQDLSAGEHTVLIWERLTQVVKCGDAFPETKQIQSVKTVSIFTLNKAACSTKRNGSYVIDFLSLFTLSQFSPAIFHFVS